MEQSHWEGYGLLSGLGDHQVLHHLPLQGQCLWSRRRVGNIHHTRSPGTLSLPGCRFHPAPSSSPAPHLPGMSFARPGLGSAVPPAPRTLPSASGSAGRPPPAGSAPCRNSLSTHHRAQDTCQNHILLLGPARQAWGHHQSLCCNSCHTPCPKPLVFEPPMSYLLCLSLPCPSPCVPAHISPPCSTTLCLGPLFQFPCPSLCVPAPTSKPPVLPCALCLSDLELLEDLWGQEWRELPPFVRADPAVPGEGCRAPTPLLCSRFHLGFPWGGGQDRSAVPHHQPGPAGSPSSPKGDPHPSLTQRRCDGFDPLQALLCQLQQFGGVGGDPLAVLCGEGVLGSLQDFHRPPWFTAGKQGVGPALPVPAASSCRAWAIRVMLFRYST